MNSAMFTSTAPLTLRSAVFLILRYNACLEKLKNLTACRSIDTGFRMKSLDSQKGSQRNEPCHAARGRSTLSVKTYNMMYVLCDSRPLTFGGAFVVSSWKFSNGQSETEKFWQEYGLITSSLNPMCGGNHGDSAEDQCR